MTKPIKPIGVFFGKNHNHEKHTAPFSPVYRAIRPSGIETYVVVAPETQMAENGHYRGVHRLDVGNGKTIAVPVKGEFVPDDFSVILDRTGTLKESYPVPVMNDKRVRDIGQGKAGNVDAIAEDVGISHAINYDGPIYLGDYTEVLQGAEPLGIRIYTHAAPTPTLDILWAPVVIGKEEGETLYIPVSSEGIPDEVVEGSRRLLRRVVDEAGVTDAFAAPSWSLIDDEWVMTAPNTGNVQFGAAKKSETSPDGYLTRQNLGKHLVDIAKRQAA